MAHSGVGIGEVTQIYSHLRKGNRQCGNGEKDCRFGSDIDYIISQFQAGFWKTGRPSLTRLTMNYL